MTLGRAVAAETIGTALLLAIVVGSGIMGERLAQGNPAIALLANSIATGAGLYTLIIVFGPISGAHFNPVVSAVSVWEGRLSRDRCVVYVLAQFGGALLGVAAAHAMFGLPIVQFSVHLRPTLGEGLGEVDRDVRLGNGYITRAAIPQRGDPDDRRCLHHERLLVHIVYIFCQSRRDVCARDDRHLCRNLTTQRTAFCRRPVGRRSVGYLVCALAARWQDRNAA